MKKGKLFIASAPSGAGKTTLLRALVREVEDLEMSVSYTTRDKRPREQDGIDYNFVSIDEFEKMQKAGEFLESAMVFDHHYGTSLRAINEKLDAGKDVVLVIDWQGAQIVRSQAENVLSIFILPPSKKELRKRLTKRGQDSKKIIDGRMDKAIDEMSHYDEYDYIVVNNDFDEAVYMLKSIILAARMHNSRQKDDLKLLLDDLLK